MGLFNLNFEEEWRDVVGFEGLYQVSNLGQVLSLPRVVGSGKYARKTKSRIRKQSIETGYAMVELYRSDGTKKMCLVHRLVAEAFIPNPDGKPTVNHIDGNKLNNHVQNLEWATQGENNEHALRTGLKYAKPVRCIETGVIYPYGAIAEAELDLHPGTVFRSIYESCKAYGKYTFEYVNSSDYVRAPTIKKESTGKAVICIETGKRYKDAKAAEADLALYETAVYNSIYEKRAVSGFTFVFENDDDYVRQPKPIIPGKPGKRVRVKCLETNLTYRSYAQAAKDTGLSESSVANSVEQERTVKGFTFVRVDPAS